LQIIYSFISKMYNSLHVEIYKLRAGTSDMRLSTVEVTSIMFNAIEITDQSSPKFNVH